MVNVGLETDCLKAAISTEKFVTQTAGTV